MKRINNIILYMVAIVVLTSCNNSFMDRFPETDVTDKNFFKTVNDLKTYTNGFYGYISYTYGGEVSDDLFSNQGAGVYNLMRNQVTPQKAGTWGWGNIRNINFFMEHYHTVQGPQREINNYVGIARLHRAWEYYKKVRSYSDVPWYSRSLKTSDAELLYKTQDSRVLVVDSIMNDLDFAVNNITDLTNKKRISLWSALAIQARVALEEASWRKYHPELELDDADRFYAIARDAAKKILDEGKFSLNTEVKDGMSGYRQNFISLDLSQNPEMIMYAKFDKSLRRHNAQATLNNYYGFSRDLMEDYLAIKDGKAVPFHTIPDYQKMELTEVFENRDSRIRDTFMQPGYIRADSSSPTIPKLGIGGYVIVKYDPLTEDQIGWDNSYTDIPMIRLAEVMLIYAEAKAELGELTQNDVDLTINKLRSRANMPQTSLDEMLNNIDPAQEQKYHNVTGAQKGAILEIRRERRIEYAGEDKRANDLYRWNLGERFEDFEGIYISKLGYTDLTGDGQPNIAIVATKEDAAQIPDADKDRYKLIIYVLSEDIIYLSEGDHGYVKMSANKDSFKFIAPKYYYSPIATQDIVLNPNLKQNKFWTN